jgi:hypothetical protein
MTPRGDSRAATSNQVVTAQRDGLAAFTHLGLCPGAATASRSSSKRPGQMVTLQRMASPEGLDASRWGPDLSG